MKVLAVYSRLYAECWAKAFAGLKRNAWTLVLPMGLVPALYLVASLVAPLGFVGGILYMLAEAALVSCYLYFVGEVVAHSNVSIAELRKSLGVYLWSVVGLRFVLFIARFALSMVLANNPNAEVIWSALTLVALILLNPAPEVIYARGTRSGVDTVQRCLRFIQDNWIEWFVPNLLILAAGWALATRVLPRLGALGLLALAFFGAAVHVVMIFRGHLFLALDGSSHRQRMFRYRGGD